MPPHAINVASDTTSEELLIFGSTFTCCHCINSFRDKLDKMGPNRLKFKAFLITTVARTCGTTGMSKAFYWLEYNLSYVLKWQAG
jgi:hypothetical protein